MATTCTGSRAIRRRAAGRVLVRREPTGETTELTPAPANVRTRAHEYGGGSYTVAGGIVVYSEFRDGRLYRIDPGSTVAIPITPAGPYRYADMRFDAPRRRFLAVREDHSGEGQPRNELVAVPLDGEAPPTGPRQRPGLRRRAAPVAGR